MEFLAISQMQNKHSKICYSSENFRDSMHGIYCLVQVSKILEFDNFYFKYKLIFEITKCRIQDESTLKILRFRTLLKIPI